MKLKEVIIITIVFIIGMFGFYMIGGRFEYRRGFTNGFINGESHAITNIKESLIEQGIIIDVKKENIKGGN